MLVGKSPFFDSIVNSFSEDRAQKGDLENLQDQRGWRDLNTKAKDFIESMVQLDPNTRPTAQKASEHEWFTASICGIDPKEQYAKAIRHWRPRQSRLPYVETFAGGLLLEPSSLPEQKHEKKRRRPEIPIDPPYRPFPRKMNKPLLPRRRPGGPVTSEVTEAIQRNWSEDAMATERAKRQRMTQPSGSKAREGRAHSPMARVGRSTSSLSVQTLPKKQQDIQSASNHEEMISSPPDITLLELGDSKSGIQYQFHGSCKTLVGNLQANDNSEIDPIRHAPIPSMADRQVPLRERSKNIGTKIRPAAHVLKSIISAPTNSKARRGSSVFDIE